MKGLLISLTPHSLVSSVNPPKAVVSLDPPWYRVLEMDSVTLKCFPEGNSTQWWHNGSLISNKSSSYFIESSRVNDSGEYECQTSSTMPSDPVQLEVHTDESIKGKREITKKGVYGWNKPGGEGDPKGGEPAAGFLGIWPLRLIFVAPLPLTVPLRCHDSHFIELQGVTSSWVLLQAIQQVFQKGETIELRCHAWKSKPLHKVSYFQDDRRKKFSHHNTIFRISEATGHHSGSYFCRGLIGARNKSSGSLNIYMQGERCAALETPDPLCVEPSTHKGG
ncbi:low affinity immunoglobulin gamma Fc region receptor III-B-like [Trichechus inunguis]